MFLFFVVEGDANSNDKPVLNVVSELRLGLANEGGTGTYWDIIKAVYGDNYQVKLRTVNRKKAVQLMLQGEADIFVGVNAITATSLLISKHHIDMEHPIHIIYDPTMFVPQGLNDLTGRIVAGKIGYGLKDYLPKDAKFYGVDSIANVSDLILNNRLDAAVTYGYNLRLADPDSQLSNVRATQKQPLYLAFDTNNKGKGLKSEFDNKMASLVRTNALEKFFLTELAYKHANLSKADNKNQIYWHIIPKIFNEKTQRLDIMLWEFEVSQYFSSQLDQLNINFQISSFGATKKYLNENNNTCAISYQKPKTKNKNFIFSNRLYAYIPPRLFVLKGSDIDQELNKAQKGGVVGLKSLLTEKSTFNLVVIANSPPHVKLGTMLSQKKFSQIITTNEDTKHETLVQMLYLGRADALILWPSIIADLHLEKKPGEFTSYTLENALFETLFTFVSCHNDDAGRKVIANINEFLKSDIHQSYIYSAIIRNMDAGSAKVMLESLEVTL